MSRHHSSLLGLASHIWFGTWLVVACLCGASGCVSQSDNEVVVYAALDREFSEPILKDFERETGIRVLAKYDIESTKTIGLVNSILQERERPRCDLFWNNEILHTLRLDREGLLAPFVAREKEQFPAAFRSADDRWYGFAARARVLIVNTKLVPAAEHPTSVLDLAHEHWRGQCGIAKPLFGTTATHAAVLWTTWGEARAREFFRALRQNAQVLSGNKQVAAAVGRGQLAFGLTDTDDALAEIEQGNPVAIVFPDQADDQMGTMLIPNTLSLPANSPNAKNAERLCDYLLSRQVEEKLASGASGQLPLHRGATIPKRWNVPAKENIRWMAADFATASRDWETTARFLRDEFTK